MSSAVAVLLDPRLFDMISPHRLSLTNQHEVLFKLVNILTLRYVSSYEEEIFIALNFTCCSHDIGLYAPAEITKYFGWICAHPGH